MTRFSRRGTLRSLTLCAIAASSFGGLAVSTAQAQQFPAKPITLIVPFPPGGATDAQFRALSIAAAKELQQPIVVMNQPGAAGTMAPANMARSAAPNGYTLAVIASSVYRVPHVQAVTYDVTKDFTYIAAISKFTFGIVVAADSPYKTVADLVAAAKSRPQQINVGAISNGSSGHIALLRWSKRAGFEANFIPYKGGAEVVQAVLGGHIDAMSESSWGPLVQQGKLRALAIYDIKRSKQFPTVPTLKEAGWDISTDSVVGIAGPKGMDPKVVQVLQDAFRKATEDANFHKTLEVSGQDVGYMDSAAYTKFIHAQFLVEKRNVDELKAAGVSVSN